MRAGPIETNLRLLFSAKEADVTKDLLPDLLSFTYDDKETNEADEVSLVLKDPEGKWAGFWKPDGGESVRAFLSSGTTSDNGLNRNELNCGRFYVDTMRVSGSPRTFEMRAVSIPLNTAIRKKIKSRAWEQKTLKGIAEQIAQEAGIKLLFDSEENPNYDRQDQKRESDLKFLSRLCAEVGLSIKLTDEQIVIFDQASYEKKTPVKVLTLGESDILSWDFESQQSEAYRSCTVIYRDPKKKKANSAGGYNMDLEKEGTSGGGDYDMNLEKIKKKTPNPAVLSFTYEDENVGENGQEYMLKKRAKSIEEAERLAKAQLRKLNARRVTGSMTLVGDVSLVAGVVIECHGFGSFDGAFIVSQATHSVSTSGFTTNVSLRRVNTNY